MRSEDDSDVETLFDGPVWRCPADDCDGYVSRENFTDMGEGIDQHLSDEHDTTLQAWAGGHDDL